MKTIDDSTGQAMTQNPLTEENDRPAGTGRRWWPWIAAAVVVVLIAGGFGLFALLSNGNGEEDATPNTSVVNSTDLVALTTLDGVLGYGEGDRVTFRSSDDGVDTVPGALSGVVTAEPTVGVYYEQGSVLYEVNDEPVVILYGASPAYRTLSTRTSDGSDILQLEEALVALGYDGFTVDENFTSATADAVEELQEDIGAEVDGVLGLGEYAFFPGPLYVADSFIRVAQTTKSGEPVVATSAVMGNTITRVPEEGSIIDQGGVLYTADARPVVLIIGEVPAYRAMAIGDRGADVEQLEQAMVDLGYAEGDVFSVDGVFDADTLAAVLAWQADLGSHTDGVVNLGEVIFLPETIRVGNVLVAPGDAVQNGAPIFESSASFTFVTVQLPTDDQDLVVVGDAVSVELPDGTKASATVTAVGTVAQTSQNGEDFFEMTVTLDDPDVALGLDEAPVDVEVVSDSAPGVLAVPVTALLALTEGGYAVEIVTEGGTIILIGVEPGLFADGFVEVEGEGLTDGMQVVVP
jgi:peptidoglycan hydrolase-like protein with peptidoglycan-binding domain